MERNFNMYPKTIGEELKCQVEYKKSKIKNLIIVNYQGK